MHAIPDAGCSACSYPEPPENDGEKGEGIVTSLEEDKELLEFWEQELNHNWGSDLLIEQVGKLLAAKERYVRAEEQAKIKAVLRKWEAMDVHTENDGMFFFYELRTLLNPPQES